MPNEEEIKLNLTGSIRDVANLQNQNNTQKAKPQPTVVSNLANLSNTRPSEEQFAKLMDVLAIMTTRMEAAHAKTHTILEKLRIALAVRLETVYRELHTLNDTVGLAFKYQVELQKQLDKNIRDITFRLSGFFGVFGETFRKSIMRMQEIVSTKAAGEAAELALVRLLGNVKFLRGFIGYEALEFKGRKKPMPFTYEVYQVLLNVPSYFDTLFINMKRMFLTESFHSRTLNNIFLDKITVIIKHIADIKGILLTTFEAQSMFINNNRSIAQAIFDMNDNVIALAKTQVSFNSDVHNISKEMLKAYSATTESIEENLNIKKLEKIAQEQVEGLKKFEVSFTSKMDDVIKKVMPFGTAIFSIARYLLSPRSLFGKLFYGYLTYRGIAYVLGPILSELFKHNRFITAFSGAVSNAVRTGMHLVGLNIPPEQSIGDYLKEKIISALDIFWNKVAFPALRGLAITLVTIYGLKNVVAKGLFGGGLWGSKAFLKGLTDAQRNMFATMERSGYSFAKNINLPNIVVSLSSKLLRVVGGVFQSTGLIGVEEIGEIMYGTGRGMKQGLKMRKSKVPILPSRFTEPIKNTAFNMISSLTTSFMGVINSLLTTLHLRKAVDRKTINLVSSTFGDTVVNTASTVGSVFKKIIGTAGKGTKVVGGAAKGIFGILGKLLPFAKGLLALLGPIGIGLAITMPLFEAGISFLRNTLIPKVFGGAENVPSSLRKTVSGLVTKLVISGIQAALGFIKNIPQYVIITAKAGADILAGIKDAIIEIFKWSWGVIKSKFGFGPKYTPDIMQVTAATTEIAEAQQEQAEKQENLYQTMIDQAEEQGKKLSTIAEYFKGGAFKTDIMELAQSVGKAVRSAFDVMVGIFDFAKGEMGGFITSLGSTLGAFLSGLMGSDRAKTFLTDITQIAQEKGYGTLAGMLGATRDSVLSMATRSAKTQVDASITFSESVGVFKDSVDVLADVVYGSKTKALASAGATSVVGEPELLAKRGTIEKGILKTDISRAQTMQLYFGSSRITSEYGEIRYKNGKRSEHAGIDIGMPIGTPIYAPLAGKVDFVGWKKGYGNTVILNHPEQQVSTLYAHLLRPLVHKGETIYPGYKIAESGSTGRSSGGHLHFEVRKINTRTTLDPIPFIDSVISKAIPDIQISDKVLQERVAKLNLEKPTKPQVETMQDLEGKKTTAQISTYGVGTTQAQTQLGTQQPAPANNVVIVNSPTNNTANVTSNNNQTKDDDNAFKPLFPWLSPIPYHELGL